MASNDRQQGAGGGGADFEALAKQYWNAWGEAMRAAAPGAGVPGAQGLQDAMSWWTQAARGGAGADVVSRFDDQARQWYAQMQQVAAQFAGRDGSAADVVEAWKRALGAAGANPFPELFRGMRGPGLQGFEHWMAEVAPLLQAWRGEGRDWLRLPAFGFAREHQERWQRLVQAQLDLQEPMEEYNALMLQASQQAYGILERKLAEREQPGLQIDSPRALFDLWIDAAEEAYAQVALSPEFRRVYGRLVDAQMRLRAAVQREVEQVCAQLGMPTRSELDGAHRKIAELERQMRRLRTGSQPRAAAAAGAGEAASASKPRAKSPTPKAHAPEPRASKRSAAKQPARKRAKPSAAAEAPTKKKRAPAPKSSTGPAARAAGAARRAVIAAGNVPAAPEPIKAAAKRKR